MITDGFLQVKDLERIHHAKIGTAFTSGMSVIEIANALKQIRIEFVHGILRDARLIPLMPRSEYSHFYNIDSRLQKALKKRGYSFGRWCLGWGFDPSNTVAKLSKRLGEDVSPIHEAVRRDCPEVYFEMFGEAPQLKEPWLEKKEFPRLSLKIVWDAACKGYVASVPETPGIMAVGYNWADALDKMQSVQRLQRNIDLIDSALERSGKSHSFRNCTSA
ncbi:hypothetical protein [uncultured Desulfobulbus sp.]|uniref:type II toxin-antitoxin system HicB family antitoxin n=1 Tax=uncultured Desulfobulbus sp. TaxID=239745 RepID=UPI0029C84A00|nr:hypothetical protein [uncultured Desulfobulbus sp.]